ncbi:MAG TPA: tripartite tricarboxylate transporter substrate binding protein [Pseudolabrys sp.]|nr:tripartite tricarboxylate transporter substrate binding protein [Pseudolabrys sp.]
MRSFKQTVAACAALVAAIAVSVPALAAGYPDHPVKVVVPFAAGGPTDVMARLVAQKLSDRLGQQFYIENLAGAGGNIGTVNVARAAPDGYTILLASSSYVVNPSLYKNCPYDPYRDFEPVILAAITPNILIVNPQVAAKTAKELIELIKANPNKFTDASPGLGTTPDLAADLFKATYNLDFAIAPYKGGGPAAQAVLANEVPMSFVAMTPTTQLVKTGKLRALAVTTKRRSSALPEVPTLAEAGITGQESETMQGVFAPKGTPKEIVALLQKEIAAIVSDPDMKAKMGPLGFEPDGGSTAEFAAYIKAEVEKWKKVIADAKIPQIQ